MSFQLESRHYLKEGDVVQHRSGRVGEVLDERALYARVRWEDGREEEVEQLDPAVTVVERAGRE